MSSIYYPARGFFIGKASKYLLILVAVGLMVYPGTIQADTMAAHPVLSAPIAAVGVQATASAPKPCL